MLELAHGDAAWIEADALHQDSGWCCGIEDCGPLPQDAVMPQPDGSYLIVASGQTFKPLGVADELTVAYDGDEFKWRAQQGRIRTMLSIDTQFWACGFNVLPSIKDWLRCLFVPTGG